MVAQAALLMISHIEAVSQWLPVRASDRMEDGNVRPDSVLIMSVSVWGWIVLGGMRFNRGFEEIKRRLGVGGLFMGCKLICFFDNCKVHFT